MNPMISQWISDKITISSPFLMSHQWPHFTEAAEGDDGTAMTALLAHAKEEAQFSSSWLCFICFMIVFFTQKLGQNHLYCHYKGHVGFVFMHYLVRTRIILFIILNLITVIACAWQCDGQEKAVGELRVVGFVIISMFLAIFMTWVCSIMCLFILSSNFNVCSKKVTQYTCIYIYIYMIMYLYIYISIYIHLFI